MSDFRYPNPDFCPALTKANIDAWVRYGQPGGHFLTAVLENNLSAAIGHGDLDNLAALHHIVSYLYNRCPGACWGSPEKVKEWPALLAKRGIDKFETD